jgi:hypothetical protein
LTPETGVWRDDLAEAMRLLGEIDSKVQEQRSRNRESFMGKVEPATPGGPHLA